MEYDNPYARTDNVERYGLTKRDTSRGYVKLIEQPVQNAPSTPVIQ